ncbi:MAG: NAD(P)-dependent oxidoreductase [Trueperaceae bacterium]
MVSSGSARVRTVSDSDVLLTGGSGRLGSELQTLLPGILAPSHAELDVTDPNAVTERIRASRPRLIVHAAAYTDVRAAETDRETCWRVNVEGTRNVAAAARLVDAGLLHVSTDYVFYGDRGGYREDDAPGPVRNYYALTKLVAEEAARAVPRSVVVRTSFRPREWPYPTAFEDLFTSQDYVDVIAPDIATIVRHFDEVPYATLHVATERKSALELARRRAPEVTGGSKRDAGVALPEDISLDVTRWRALRAAWAVADEPAAG